MTFVLLFEKTLTILQYITYTTMKPVSWHFYFGTNENEMCL